MARTVFGQFVGSTAGSAGAKSPRARCLLSVTWLALAGSTLMGLTGCQSQPSAAPTTQPAEASSPRVGTEMTDTVPATPPASGRSVPDEFPYGGRIGSYPIEPGTKLYGVSGHASKVVFLVDTSGSMIGVFGDVKAKLKKTVMRLPCDVRQGCVSFDIITFSDGKEPRIFSKIINGGKAQLMPATDEIKKKAAEFIDDQVASGGTLPLPAIRAAFATDPKPDLIYVLTDGFDNVVNFDDVAAAFDNGTADGQTRVNCVQFVSNPDPKLAQVLQNIATHSHGQFNQIEKADLQ